MNKDETLKRLTDLAAQVTFPEGVTVECIEAVDDGDYQIVWRLDNRLATTHVTVQMALQSNEKLLLQYWEHELGKVLADGQKPPYYGISLE